MHRKLVGLLCTDNKSEEEVNDELQKHCDKESNNVDSSWKTVKMCKGRYLIQIELEVCIEA